MNLIILLSLGFGLLGTLWAFQSVLLVCHGEPIVAPLRYRTKKPTIRWPMKLMLQTVLFGLLLGFPWLIGESPLDYHLARLSPVRWDLFCFAFASVLGAYVLLFAIEIAAGWIRLARLFDPGPTARKILRSFLTPIPLALLEEAVFRGVILEQMLNVLPGTRWFQVLAVVLAGAVFASVHFLRPQKRLYLPALGLFVLGCVLGTAYIAGGRTYWLPAAIHSAGILGIQLSRTFAQYRGPAWLIGYPSYPIAGIMGMTGMILISAFLVINVSAVASL